ncbi:MAG: IS1595 family transposase [Bacteroidales bacterium]|nr:IS1595 family transposase [Bacteroidales bacterium]
MLTKEEISPEMANELFQDQEKVLQFLADVKWKDGFVCRKCGNINYCEGKTKASRRCTRCKTDESATAHTLFHNCKFPMNKAFYIAYTLCVQGKVISSYELANALELNQMTCWKFRKRIQDCLVRHGNPEDRKHVPLETILIVEEIL